MFGSELFCSRQVSGNEFGKHKKLKMNFTLQRRKAPPLHANGERSFSLDWIAHQQSKPTRVKHGESKDFRVRYVLHDTTDLVEKGGGLSMPSFDHKKPCLKRCRRNPCWVGISLVCLPCLLSGRDRFVHSDGLEKRYC